MKFIALKTNIKEAINAIEKSVGENANLPILKNILIEADNNTILFSATNLEVAASFRVAGKVIENGKFTVPASLLSSLIGNIQTDRLNFEQKDNNLEITTDNYNATINGSVADDFPITPKIKNTENFIEIKAAFLRDAIQQVTVAAQFSDLRPELSSVLFNFSLESLILAATDGFRLTEKTIPSNLFITKNKEPFKILVPLRTNLELVRILRDDEMVRMYWDDNQVLFKTDQIEFISRLIDGNFPDYSAIVPKEYAAEIVVERDEFANAIKLAGVFGQKNSEIRIKIHSNKKAIEVISADQSLGENTNILPAKIQGEIQDVFFNWRYLADPIKAIKDENIFIGLQEDAGPALVRAMGDTSYFYVLKPILKS